MGLDTFRKSCSGSTCQVPATVLRFRRHVPAMDLDVLPLDTAPALVDCGKTDSSRFGLVDDLRLVIRAKLTRPCARRRQSRSGPCSLSRTEFALFIENDLARGF